MLDTIRRIAAAMALLVTALALPATAQERITLALQEGGTAAWEIAAMQARGIDARHGVIVAVRGVVDSRAGQVALQAGAADAILSDFVWTSIQRHEGADFTFVPHSLAVGGLMVAPGGPVATVADLAGRTLAIAGGPVDKSYVILQAHYAAQTGRVLPDDITAQFGAPPLVNELLTGGGADAALNFWHFNARARVAGMQELVSVREMLAALGVTHQPPLLGWVFSEANAAARGVAFRRFLDASFDTKAALLSDDALWEEIRPAMDVGDDDALFVALRDGYRAGIVTQYGPADIAAAAQSFDLMARFGGGDLIGERQSIAPGTFWDGYRR